MSLFEFELAPVEQIQPWGTAPNLSLSWFALSYGSFQLNVGDATLFRYSDDILEFWNSSNPYADYQIAAFARDMLECFKPALAPLPEFLRPYAWDWERLRELVRFKAEETDDDYEALRWLGERSPFTSYLVQSPQISFILKENDIIIGWDNRGLRIEGVTVWDSDFGSYAISIDEFTHECQSFANRLLAEMSERLQNIVMGKVNAQIVLDADDLLNQHELWRVEFEGFFSGDYVQDFSWEEINEAFKRHLLEFNKAAM